ncbi:hypothetical protein [Enhygromyxa salina]|uniref:Uncharacterized protein n=1 Tax=Enhygromyxa salina TaxID=215803 RepID=A0A2S9YQQ6_9BACT|nr:hypothetical protein [Enhygromyxa salina]PRQ07434.1 hypothetical protein ENSA7_28270 [Enhygromyxa salina]
MRSLLSLLDGAVRRSASAVTLESGQPVVYTTARGAEAESTVLPRTDLFEMIVAAVDDAQQVELAVGNPVEFAIEAGASWTVYAEPGMEGITVRARRQGAGRGALEIELDDDAEPRSPAPGSERGEPVDTLDVPVGNRHRDLTVEALDAPALDDPDHPDDSISVDYSIDGPSPAEAAFESGTWALAEDDDFGVGPIGSEDGYGADSLGTLGEGVDARPARSSPLPEAEEFGARGFAVVPREPEPADGHIGVPADDEDDVEPLPSSAPEIDQHGTRSPTVRAMSASPAKNMGSPDLAAETAGRPGGGMSAVGGAAGMVTRLDHGNAMSTAAAARASTRREMTAVRSPDADTLRELPTFGHGEPELNDIVAHISEGALVYVREPGFIDTLAQAFLSPSITIDDQADPREVWSRVRGLPPGAIVIVRCEDPSRLLGWILRRLEEGYRVFVETRARTPEGARRVLLGVAASERAERWLDSQLTLTLEPGEAGPQLLAL